jgi:hypothetical protein
MQNEPDSKNAVRQHAAQVSAQVRRQNGHDQRVAAGVPCRRCWICFPENGKRDTRLPTKGVNNLEQPSSCSEPPKELSFSERALFLAEAGTPETAAALILGIPVQTFQEKVQESYGVSWSAVLERAKHKVKSDLISSAIRAARLGDWKPYLSLEKAGISLSLAEREDAATTAKPATSIAEIDEQLALLQNEIAEKQKAGSLNLGLTGFKGVKSGSSGDIEL